jgi:hypothetical protein
MLATDTATQAATATAVLFKAIKATKKKAAHLPTVATPTVTKADAAQLHLHAAADAVTKTLNQRIKARC